MTAMPDIPYKELEPLRRRMEQEKGFWEKGRYPYIALPWQSATQILDITIEQFRLRRGREPRTFLEVGCGYGIITHYAQTKLGMQATGIDIVDKYIQMSKAKLQGRFLWRDALRFKHYGKYDIIYFYQPFLAKDLKIRFCRRVARQARGLVAPFYNLRDTPFQLPEGEWKDNKWIKSPWEPFAIASGHFAPYDGLTKELIRP